jgi:hypothetical protein
LVCSALVLICGHADRHRAILQHNENPHSSLMVVFMSISTYNLLYPSERPLLGRTYRMDSTWRTPSFMGTKSPLIWSWHFSDLHPRNVQQFRMQKSSPSLRSQASFLCSKRAGTPRRELRQYDTGTTATKKRRKALLPTQSSPMKTRWVHDC